MFDWCKSRAPSQDPAPLPGLSCGSGSAAAAEPRLLSAAAPGPERSRSFRGCREAHPADGASRQSKRPLSAFPAADSPKAAPTCILAASRARLPATSAGRGHDFRSEQPSKAGPAKPDTPRAPGAPALRDTENTPGSSSPAGARLPLPLVCPFLGSRSRASTCPLK